MTGEEDDMERVLEEAGRLEEQGLPLDSIQLSQAYAHGVLLTELFCFFNSRRNACSLSST
jgi:hypothetical protein